MENGTFSLSSNVDFNNVSNIRIAWYSHFYEQFDYMHGMCHTIVDKHQKETSVVLVGESNDTATSTVCASKLRKDFSFEKCFPFQKTFHHSTSRIMICMCLRCCSCFSHNYFTYVRTHQIHNIGVQFGKWIHICFCCFASFFIWLDYLRHEKSPIACIPSFDSFRWMF